MSTISTPMWERWHLFSVIESVTLCEGTCARWIIDATSLLLIREWASEGIPSKQLTCMRDRYAPAIAIPQPASTNGINSCCPILRQDWRRICFSPTNPPSWEPCKKLWVFMVNDKATQRMRGHCFFVRKKQFPSLAYQNDCRHLHPLISISQSSTWSKWKYNTRSDTAASGMLTNTDQMPSRTLHLQTHPLPARNREELQQQQCQSQQGERVRRPGLQFGRYCLSAVALLWACYPVSLLLQQPSLDSSHPHLTRPPREAFETHLHHVLHTRSGCRSCAPRRSGESAPVLSGHASWVSFCLITVKQRRIHPSFSSYDPPAVIEDDRRNRYPLSIMSPLLSRCSAAIFMMIFSRSCACACMRGLLDHVDTTKWFVDMHSGLEPRRPAIKPAQASAILFSPRAQCSQCKFQSAQWECHVAQQNGARVRVLRPLLFAQLLSTALWLGAPNGSDSKWLPFVKCFSRYSGATGTIKMSLRVLVGCKRVIDYAVKVRVRPDKLGVVTDGVKHSMNPFDEIALEQAIQLKDKSLASEVIAASIGPSESSQTLRTALGMGADRGILVESNQPLEPLAVSKILAKIVERENVNLVILGKQAIDDDCNQTGQMLAALLGWPQGTFASKVDVDGNHVKVVREIDGGLETVKLFLTSCSDRWPPAEHTTIRHTSKHHEGEEEASCEGDGGWSGHWRCPAIGSSAGVDPPVRRAGSKVEDVADLVSKLKAAGAL